MEPDNLSLIPREDGRLARVSDEVEDFKSPDFQLFIERLIACGEDNMGVGIAAPQVGRNMRLFIMAPKPGPRYPDAPHIEPFAVINPEIIRLYGEVQKGWEGCLSVPGFRGMVPRYQYVDAAWLDRHGERQEATLGGFAARIFQHEFDHLEGILYTERMDPEDPLLTLEEFAAKTGTQAPPS